MGSFSVLGNYLTYSVKGYLKSRIEMSVIDEQQQPVLWSLWFTDDTTYRIHSHSRPPLRLSPSCTRSDMPSPYQHLEQAHWLRDSNGSFWVFHPNYATQPLESSGYPLPEQPIPLPFFSALKWYGKLDDWRLVTQEGLVIFLKGSVCL